ncbi:MULTISPECIES: hypothetical protein [unclassified Janthinobacterium]|jgi:hypothetical protein|uniref:hypothetical protein n=1 Tax=unclassified Janthinobacterium TaxID=2610881 RepID=UPI000C6FDBCD|nr:MULTISPECIES: hypothetical protein [unclassified Janthinobacterium]PKV45609.1 hypothetical protein CLU92_2990 [Janthinobacterium sp. 61]TDY34139.1 hypothetical protein C8C89_1946 [Janthinobacterium sp. 75]
MNEQPFDQGIPLLTEVLSGPEALHETTAEPETVPSIGRTDMIEVADIAEMEAAPAPAIAQPDWDAIEQRLTQRILHQVQGKIDHLLEERIAHVLQTALQNALIGMRGALRADLQQSLEQIVAHAVSHELGHLHPPAQ